MQFINFITNAMIQPIHFDFNFRLEQIYNIILHNPQQSAHKALMINYEMYTQMGFTEEQVRRAQQYSQKNKIDMFDALQQLQNRDYADKERTTQANIPQYSYLRSLRNFKLNDYEIIYSRSGIKQNSYVRDEIREVNTPVGLFNVSNCCYLNSLLQCYFLMGAFTREILMAQEIAQLPDQPGTKNKRIKNQYLLLSALKQMFARMKLSSRRYLDPTPVLKNLVNSVGEKIEYGDEKDLNEINMEIVERLSECLMYTRKYFSKGEGSPSKIKKRQNIKNLFYGEKVEYIEDIEGETVSDFMGIILNPKHDNILFALDDEFNYDVEIDGKIMKRHTFIRSLPKFLFLTISRIEFQKKGHQFLKNSEKIAFDFVIYLDQYLQSNREQSKIKAPKIRQLQNLKTIRKSQLNHLNMLEQKLEQCKAHAKYLSGWQQKFPKQEEVQAQKISLRNQIEQIEKDLEQVQSRKEKFLLMYIFVHRGDAISGHYWGYGRNGNYWYRFDVNCVPIREADILIDMEKSAGIPYALVYARDDQIESFAYPYYTAHQAGQSLLDSSQEQKDYSFHIPEPLKKKIIDQNIAMHDFIQKQKTRTIVDNVIKEYKTKFNIVKSEAEKYTKAQTNPKIPLYSNFACYLESFRESQFMKYNLFSVAIFSKAQMTCKELIQDQKLLKAIQKAFRKKIKGKMALKHFALECEPVEGPNYIKASQEYIVGKKCLQFLKLISINIKEWPKIPNLPSLLEQIIQAVRSDIQGVYLKNLTRQVVATMLLDLAKKGEPLKLSWSQACSKQNPLLQEQLKALNYKQLPKETKMKPTEISRIELEQDWTILSLRKGFQSEVMAAVKEIVIKLGEGMEIYKKNTKEKVIVRLEGEKKQQSEDLI